MLMSRSGIVQPMEVGARMDIVRRMESYAAMMDNGNREPWTEGMLWEMCADDYIAETVRYYREQADNFMAEVAA
jgi:hypothetical protein